MTSNTDVQVLVGVLLGVLFLTMLIYEPKVINFLLFGLMFSLYFRALYERYND